MPATPTYKEAGVDIALADTVVDDISRVRGRTEGKHRLLQSFGQFAACYDLSGFREPVMVTTCDGVGTKLLPLLRYGLAETAGKDLVAMSVNDILTSNAKPLMFLDYIGMGRLDRELIAGVIAGIVDALAACDCILAGGETAEMPGMVEDGMIELSGFCVGAAEKSEMTDPATIRPGDVVLGLPSDGFHANGWSLLRRILADHASEFTEAEMRHLLVPTRIYHREVSLLREAGLRAKGMAHITGGGVPGNFPRILDGLGAALKLPRWEDPTVRKVLSFLDEEEAIRTFNMGIGWTLVFASDVVDDVRAVLPEAVVLGEITDAEFRVELDS